MSNKSQIISILLRGLVATNSNPTTTSSCVTAIGIPSLDPACLPLKAEGVNLAPNPKFVFSAVGHCATFARDFLSITLIPDLRDVPAGKQCIAFAYSGERCTGGSVESDVSIGCFQISKLSLTKTARSVKYVCD